MTAPVFVCRKWAAHPGEPLDERYAGASPADDSALELALRHADLLGTTVTAVTVGPPSADSVVREALASGASRAVRIDAPATLDGVVVAELLATVATGARWVWCGDYSLDRGTGSVPSFLAGHLRAAQALGLVAVDLDGDRVRATRRLDGGRRDVLLVDPPAVLSVEGGVAPLRRAGLAATRAAGRAQVEVIDPPRPSAAHGSVVTPYRPRALALDPPGGNTALDRLRALTAAGGATRRGESLIAEPAEAASRIVGALREWGYLP